MRGESGNSSSSAVQNAIPADVREAIMAAEDILRKIQGALPVNVGVPLISARGKLRVASVAIDAWEASLRLNAIEESGRK